MVLSSLFPIMYPGGYSPCHTFLCQRDLITGAGAFSIWTFRLLFQIQYYTPGFDERIKALDAEMPIEYNTDSLRG